MNLPAVRRITREVLDDFAADNVRYLELRSTPRALSDADLCSMQFRRLRGRDEAKF